MSVRNEIGESVGASAFIGTCKNGMLIAYAVFQWATHHPSVGSLPS